MQIERWPGESSGVPLATAVERWNDPASWPRLALRGDRGVTEHAVLKAAADGDTMAVRLDGIGLVPWASVEGRVVGSTRVPAGPMTGRYDGSIYILTEDGRVAIDLVRGDREVIASWLLRAIVAFGSDSQFRSRIGIERAISSINSVYSVRAIDVAPEDVAA